MYMKNTFNFIFIFFIMLTMASCSEGNDPSPKTETKEVAATTTAIIYNLPADPATSYTSTGTPIGTTGKFRFFSFANGQAVSNSDSLTSKWDIGLGELPSL